MKQWRPKHKFRDRWPTQEYLDWIEYFSWMSWFKEEEA